MNFLLTWKLFNDLKLNDSYLDYISIEGYPLPINQINKIYERYPKLVKLWIELKKEMPPLWSGTHRIILNAELVVNALACVSINSASASSI